MVDSFHSKLTNGFKKGVRPGGSDPCFVTRSVRCAAEDSLVPHKEAKLMTFNWWCPAPIVGIVELNGIVLPAADPTDLVRPRRSFVKRHEPAAGTRELPA
jgi:hypothetical protein